MELACHESNLQFLSIGKKISMKNKQILLFMVAFLFVLFAGVGYAEEPVIVIAHPGVAQGQIASGDLNEIFLGKKKTWENGEKLVPAMLESGACHESFVKTFVKKTASQFSTFWKQAIFTGQGIPPKTIKSEAEMVSFVASTPGAIGYISSSTAHEGVKVLEIK